jgi:hypothetical protein
LSFCTCWFYCSDGEFLLSTPPDGELIRFDELDLGSPTLRKTG